MDGETIIQGRLIGAQEVESIRRLLAANPEWSRWRLSRELCQLWEWRTPDGQLKDMAARTLLHKLELRGYLCLPARRWATPNRMRSKRLLPIDHSTAPIAASLNELLPLQVEEISRSPQELALFDWLLHRYHYLSHASSVGLNLKYLVYDRAERPLGCLLFGSAAWRCAARDRFIGWKTEARQTHLQEITNNTRLLILPWVHVPQLVSQVLQGVAQRLRPDWQDKYARPLSLVETFVDTSRFTGACYRAANWIYLGQTTGRTRQDRSHRISAPAKAVFVYPLTPDFARQLTA
jgi:hypothetical protein